MNPDDTAMNSPMNGLYQGVSQLKVRSELHIARRLYHVLGLAVVLSIFHNVSRTSALTALLVSIMIVIPIDILRARVPALNKLIFKLFHPILRKNEVNGLSGMSSLLLGTFLVIFIFPKQIATLSLFMLAVGDPVSSIFGVLYGRDKIMGNKSLQGTLAGFVACTLVSMAFYTDRGIMSDRLVLVSLLTGIIGALGELIPIGRLDDNFTFPVLSAMMLWGVFSLFGGFA